MNTDDITMKSWCGAREREMQKEEKVTDRLGIQSNYIAIG